MNRNINNSSQDLGEVAAIINTLLADEYLLYATTRRAQRDIKGTNFNGLNKFFENQFEILDKIIYSTGERVQSVGRFFPDSINDFLKAGRLPASDEESYDQSYIIKRLLKYHESLIRLLRRDIITIVEVHKDSETAAFLSDLLEQHEKIVWMLRTHLQ